VESLLLRSFALLVLFQLLAAVVLVAGRRGRATVAVAILLASIAGMVVVQRSTDPGLFFASAVLCGFGVDRAVRAGGSVWRVTASGLVPVVVASALAFAGQDPAHTTGALREQFEEMAKAGAARPPGAGSRTTGPDTLAAGTAAADSQRSVAPEERVWREQTAELSAFAARWAMRLLPAGIVGMGLLQTLLVVVLAGKLARAAGGRTAVLPVSRWQVPFGAVWGLVAGLALMALRQPVVTVVGVNLAVLVAAWLAVQGFAVFLAALERTVAPAMRKLTLLLATLTTLVAWPLVTFGLALLGLLDLWVDFRKLRPAAEDS
jgi:hypothetical protein